MINRKARFKFKVAFSSFHAATLVLVLFKQKLFELFLNMVKFLFLDFSSISFHILIPRKVNEFWRIGFLTRGKK